MMMPSRRQGSKDKALLPGSQGKDVAPAESAPPSLAGSSVFLLLPILPARLPLLAIQGGGAAPFCPPLPH